MSQYEFEETAAHGVLVLHSGTKCLAQLIEPGGIFISEDTGNIWRVVELESGFPQFGLNSRVTVQRLGYLNRGPCDTVRLEDSSDRDPDGARQSHNWSVAIMLRQCRISI